MITTISTMIRNRRTSFQMKPQNAARRRLTTSSCAQLRVVGAEEAGPRDGSSQDEIDEAAERCDGDDRENDRPADRPALLLVQIKEDRGAGQDRDERGYAREQAPLLCEQRRLLARR
jgi:hypothetical protein